MDDKIKKTLKSLGLILLLLLFSSIFFTIFNIDLANISDKKYVIYLSLSNLILLVIFGIIYWKDLVKDAKKFFLNFGKNMETSVKYWLIGYAIMIVSNLIITFVLSKELAGNEQDVRNYIDAFPLLMIFDVVIYAPIVEELAFRKSIREATSNKWIYVIISGFIFGFLHIGGYITGPSDLVYLIPYSALGISFALLYYKTDNIFSSITVHSLHNLLAVMLYLIGDFL